MKQTAFKNSQGVTLIEVLIAVLVLSIGLLGLGALQGVALQSGQLSYQRTQATNLAYQIADDYRTYRSQAQPPEAIRANWEAQRVRHLPNGDLEHSLNANGELEVTITWRDDRDDALNGDVSDEINFLTRI